MERLIYREASHLKMWAPPLSLVTWGSPTHNSWRYISHNVLEKENISASFSQTLPLRTFPSYNVILLILHIRSSINESIHAMIWVHQQWTDQYGYLWFINKFNNLSIKSYAYVTFILYTYTSIIHILSTLSRPNVLVTAKPQPASKPRLKLRK